MKKLIEIKEISLPIGDVYTTSKYPSTGMYLVNGNSLVVVYSVSGGATCCCYLGLLIDNKDMFTEELEQTSGTTTTGIDQDVFLKTVAIISNPDLGAKLFD